MNKSYSKEKELEEQPKEEEEEFVLLDLDSVSLSIDIPSNAPYVLSDLDTLNPILIIDDKIKLIGEYEETIGTCLVFSETDAVPVVHEETGPSEANILSGKHIMNPQQTPAKWINSIARFHKVLKFRPLLEEAAGVDGTADEQRD